MKVFVVGEATYYASFIKNSVLVNNIKEADIVLFTGGEDVDPSLYGEQKCTETQSYLPRDIKEKEIFNQITKKQLALGICRGSQFLCVMNGGKLVQHCTNHAIHGTHEITNENLSYDITSTHHQMQYPYNLNKEDYTILYKSANIRSSVYTGYGIDTSLICLKGEPEIVVYHKVDKPMCLAIQGHPEYMRKNAPVINMLNTLINKLLKELKNESK